MTVIDSVLKMRNAPANRAIAAISAVVAWKSVVDARSAAARSLRRGQHVRLASSAATRARRSRPPASAPAGQADVDAGHARLAEDRLRGRQRDDDGPAEGAGQRPVAGMMPMTR